MKKTILFVLTVLFVAAFMCQSSHAQTFKAGAAFRVVTPDPLLPVSGGVGAPEPVNKKMGELTARAIVLEKDKTRVAFVSVDFLGFPSTLCNKVRAQVKGIPAENVIIGCTHTHSAPDTYAFPNEQGEHGADLKYLDSVCAKTAEAVNEAVEKLQPAVLKVAVGKPQGKIAFNAYAENLYDPRCDVMQLLYADGKDKGKAIATMIDFAVHPEVLGNEQGILSPDLCGPLYDRIAEKTGAMGQFFNSAQGGMVTADNRGPDGKDMRVWEECVRIGNLLADEALRFVESAPAETNPTLFCVAQKAEFPVESTLMRFIIEKSVMNFPISAEGKVMTQLNLVNVGTAQMVNIPGEALPNIGFYVRRHMPTEKSFLLGLTNDAFGYMLVKEDWNSCREYNYISRTCLGEMTGEIYEEAILKLIESSPKPDPEPAK